jgi:hypothetical protein
MRAIITAAAIVAATLTGCGGWDPREDTSTVPKSMTTATAPKPKTVSVIYKGPDGYNLAVIKANEWCDENVGPSNVHLVKNNKTAGRATFSCVH